MRSAARACAIVVAAAAITAGVMLIGTGGAASVRASHHSAGVAASQAVKSSGPAAGQAVPGSHPMVPTSPSSLKSDNDATTAVRNITTVGSLNWAGYAVSRRHATFRAVKATFFVPYLTCAKMPGGTFSSHWAGFDGFVSGSHSVEQIGIAADCSATGKASYFAWFEMFPLPEARARIGIRAGDSVTAAVSYDAADKEFKLVLNDNTEGQHFAVQRRCPDVKVGRQRLSCPRSSAEVISEAPATGTSSHLTIAHLSDYGAVSFEAISITDASGQTGGLVSGHWDTAKIIEMRASGAVIALPTPTQAATFDTYWLATD